MPPLSHRHPPNLFWTAPRVGRLPAWELISGVVAFKINAESQPPGWGLVKGGGMCQGGGYGFMGERA